MDVILSFPPPPSLFPAWCVCSLVMLLPAHTKRFLRVLIVHKRANPAAVWFVRLSLFLSCRRISTRGTFLPLKVYAYPGFELPVARVLTAMRCVSRWSQKVTCCTNPPHVIVRVFGVDGAPIGCPTTRAGLFHVLGGRGDVYTLLRTVLFICF